MYTVGINKPVYVLFAEKNSCAGMAYQHPHLKMNKQESSKVYQSNIWAAVVTGDIETLRKLINAGTWKAKIRKQADSKRWTILHHAVMSRNLEMVQLVTEGIKPDVDAETEDGMTPLQLACYQQAPVKLITYLMQHTKQYNSPSPLEYAVNQNRVDLAKAVILHEAKHKSRYVKRSLAALYSVTTATGNVEMLQCFLDGPSNVGYLFIHKKKDDLTGMDRFAEVASYSFDKKVACFKALFNVAHPIANPTAPRRYNVNDILKLALHSFLSTSLIPYFIETERIWEHRVQIHSLYKRLLPEYELLALLVLCECAPVTVKRKQLEPILEEMGSKIAQDVWYDQLGELYVNAFTPSDEHHTCATLQLLSDFATFAQTIELGYFQKMRVRDVGTLYNAAYHRAIECLMTMYNDTADDIVQLLMTPDDQHSRAIVVFPLLRYCTTILMRPDAIGMAYLHGYRLLYWFVHLFGTWNTIQLLPIGLPLRQIFTLKRAARDAVREAVLQGMKATDVKSLFFERLNLLPVPKELNKYLRYSDYSTIVYFLEHFETVMHALYEDEEEEAAIEPVEDF
uniref:ANK_REP_REGION domain-containing protein n=1 Tax=Anopheles merus TaxID=30066 RepID=A0A182VA41_ANOME